jgi:diguanylate cyclase (GGDEF)-like protein
MVARFGGDEFVILLTDISSRDVVEKAAGRIVAEMNQTFDIEPHEIHNSASVGVAMWQDIHLTAKELIKRADAALYAAKEHGRNQFCFFDAATMTIAARSAEARNGNASDQMAHEAAP